MLPTAVPHCNTDKTRIIRKIIRMQLNRKITCTWEPNCLNSLLGSRKSLLVALHKHKCKISTH